MSRYCLDSTGTFSGAGVVVLGANKNLPRFLKEKVKSSSAGQAADGILNLLVCLLTVMPSRFHLLDKYASPSETHISHHYWRLSNLHINW